MNMFHKMRIERFPYLQNRIVIGFGDGGFGVAQSCKFLFVFG